MEGACDLASPSEQGVFTFRLRRKLGPLLQHSVPESLEDVIEMQNVMIQ